MGYNEVWVQAAREGAALVPSRAYGILRIRGNDRQEFVHNYTTNEVKSLRPGQGCTAAISNWKGTVTDHVRILCRPHELLIVGTYGRQGVVRAFLDKFNIGVDVQIEDLTGKISGLEIGGPAALRILPAAKDLPLDGHRTVQFAPPLCDLAESDNPLTEPDEPDTTPADEAAPDATPTGETPFDASAEIYLDQDEGIRDTTGIVVRTQGFRGGGILVLVPLEADAAMRDRLRRLGATAIGQDAWELVRIEEGIPEFGRDIGEDTNVWEARLDRSVSLNKGCYLGQEIVARLFNYKKIQRFLMGVSVEGPEPVETGAAVLLDGEIAGKITSCVPDLHGGVRALAMIQAQAATAGTSVAIGQRAAVLQDLPFWSVVPA